MEPVHVISLARSAQRRRRFEQANPALHYVFRDAVDGAAMSPSELEATGLFRPDLPYTPGAYGVALSHHRLWQEAIASGRPLTVAEDDAVFRQDFHEAQAHLLGQLPPDWDLVMWGWNFDAALSLNLLPGVAPTVIFSNQESLRVSLDAFRSGTDLPVLVPLDRCFGLPAYTISPAGARRFTALCFPLAPFELPFPLMLGPISNNGIDIAMSRIYAATLSHVCLPPLAVTPNDHALSTVQTGNPAPLAAAAASSSA